MNPLPHIFHLFQDIVAAIKKKEYNFLDQRKMDFDQDYEEFCKRTNDLHVGCVVKSLVTATRFRFPCPLCVALISIPHSAGRATFITGVAGSNLSLHVLISDEWLRAPFPGLKGHKYSSANDS